MNSPTPNSAHPEGARRRSPARARGEADGRHDGAAQGWGQRWTRWSLPCCSSKVTISSTRVGVPSSRRPVAWPTGAAGGQDQGGNRGCIAGHRMARWRCRSPARGCSGRGGQDRRSQDRDVRRRQRVLAGKCQLIESGLESAVVRFRGTAPAAPGNLRRAGSGHSTSFSPAPRKRTPEAGWPPLLRTVASRRSTSWSRSHATVTSGANAQTLRPQRRSLASSSYCSTTSRPPTRLTLCQSAPRPDKLDKTS